MSARRACRKDANHDLVKEALQWRGFTCYDTWQVAQYIPGFPDLLVVKNRRVILVEVKDGNAPLTIAEKRFVAGYEAPLVIVRSLDDLALVDAEV